MGELILPGNKKSKIDETIDLINAIRNEKFDEQWYLLESIHQFHQAVTQNQPKVHTFLGEDDYEKKRQTYCYKTGKKKGQFRGETYKNSFYNKYHWSENCRLDEWMAATMDEIDLNLKQIEEKKKNYSVNITTTVQRQYESFADGLEPMELQRFDKIYYDWLEWEWNHQKEAIKKFLSGQITLKENEVGRDELKRDIYNLVMGGANKKMEILREGKKLQMSERAKKFQKPNLN